ncbi:uncharacterized [Tachysurus ichikawai]
MVDQLVRSCRQVKSAPLYCKTDIRPSPLSLSDMNSKKAGNPLSSSPRRLLCLCLVSRSALADISLISIRFPEVTKERKGRTQSSRSGVDKNYRAETI